MKKVIISVTNDLTTDQRVNKVATSLLNAGFSVTLLGAVSKNYTVLNNRKYTLYRFTMLFKKGFFFYLEFNVRLFFFLMRHRGDIFLSNDLDTLCANFLASKLKNVKLVYDSHELFPEVPELLNRPVVKFIWLSIESMLLKRVRYMYTVSESIANYYNGKYGVDMSVVSNFPRQKKSTYKMRNKNKILIYQGAINKDRGIELMIQSMKYIDAKLYIVGGGDILEDMITYANELNLMSKIVFFGRVSFDALFDITKKADLGLSFESDTCLAYRYSLPNKIFDYINAEIPILVSDLPEFKKIIDAYPIGELLEARNAKVVSNQINKILAIPRSTWLEHLLRAKQEYCWEEEEKKLLPFFN